MLTLRLSALVALVACSGHRTASGEPRNEAARVAVHATTFELKNATIDSGVGVTGLAFDLQCSANARFGMGEFEVSGPKVEHEVPLTVTWARTDGLDVASVSFADAELAAPDGPDRRDRACRGNLAVDWADSSGNWTDRKWFTVAATADESDITSALVAQVTAWTWHHRFEWAPADGRPGPRSRRCAWYATPEAERRGAFASSYTDDYGPCDALSESACAPDKKLSVPGSPSCCDPMERWSATQGCYVFPGDAGECRSKYTTGLGCATGPIESAAPAAGITSAALGPLAFVPAGKYWTVPRRVVPYVVQHEVTLDHGLYVMTSEVTQAQWRAIMGTNPSAWPDCGGDCPVDSVTWHEAVEFARRVSELEGVTYRLLTEAEWEWAAWGGAHFAYAGSNDLDAVAWNRGNTRAPQPACRKARNGFGLCDMSGNVWEWTSDGYWGHDPSTGYQPVVNPTGGAGEGRVRKGGSWLAWPGDDRVYARSDGDPARGYEDGGFRLARVP